MIETARAADYQVIGLIDAHTHQPATSVLGVPVHQSVAAVPSHARVLIAIGDSRARERIDAEVDGSRLLTLVHPTAVVANDATVASGTVVFAMAVIQPGSTIGRHAIVNTAAVVEHDNTLGDFVQLATGARLTGNVRIGTGSFIGAGAVVLPGVTIGEWCTVGAGAVVTRDVRDGVTVAGVPARELSGSRLA